MSFSTRTMRPEDWKKLKWFRPSEFRDPGKMGYEFMLWLDRVREEADVSMEITSSYRSPAYNAQVGGAQDSSHTDEPCDAADIGKRPHPGDKHWNYARAKIVMAAIKLGCTRIGIYPGGSLHLDRTENERPAPRLWVAVDNPAR
jgi:uncharacterized protein YcbK (DUF882 family)